MRGSLDDLVVCLSIGDPAGDHDHCVSARASRKETRSSNPRRTTSESGAPLDVLRSPTANRHRSRHRVCRGWSFRDRSGSYGRGGGSTAMRTRRGSSGMRPHSRTGVRSRRSADRPGDVVQPRSLTNHVSGFPENAAPSRAPGRGTERYCGMLWLGFSVCDIAPSQGRTARSVRSGTRGGVATLVRHGGHQERGFLPRLSVGC
jgi:hypothetical protein